MKELFLKKVQGVVDEGNAIVTEWYIYSSHIKALF
jgi:hypothetical protein